MEEKEKESAKKAKQLIESFRASFYDMSYTMHPSNLPGEAQGKSSNESWAANQAIKDYPESIRSNVIVTVMDGEHWFLHKVTRLTVLQPTRICLTDTFLK